MASVFSHAIAAVAIGGVAVGGRSRAIDLDLRVCRAARRQGDVERARLGLAAGGAGLPGRPGACGGALPGRLSKRAGVARHRSKGGDAMKYTILVYENTADFSARTDAKRKDAYWGRGPRLAPAAVAGRCSPRRDLCGLRQRLGGRLGLRSAPKRTRGRGDLARTAGGEPVTSRA